MQMIDQYIKDAVSRALDDTCKAHVIDLSPTSKIKPTIIKYKGQQVKIRGKMIWNSRGYARAALKREFKWRVNGLFREEYGPVDPNLPNRSYYNRGPWLYTEFVPTGNKIRDRDAVNNLSKEVLDYVLDEIFTYEDAK